MDRLPVELIDAILGFCIQGDRKNNVLELRLVCKGFDRILKPYTCRTLGLDDSRLNRNGSRPHPHKDALQTIGDHCKGLYIDMRLVRDSKEIMYLLNTIAKMPSVRDFCQDLHIRYCMSKQSFTVLEYQNAVQDLLSHCSQVERLRLHLLSRLVRNHCDAAVTIFVNTFKALTARSKDSANIKVLVLDNVPDFAFNYLWKNEHNGQDMLNLFSKVEHLSISLEHCELLTRQASIFELCFWRLIHEGRLKSLCLVAVDPRPPPCNLKQTRSQIITHRVWNANALSEPYPRWHSHLRCLELKKVESSATALLSIIGSCRDSLEELFLNEIYLKVETSENCNTDSTKELWIGLPNQRPQNDCKWVAIKLRRALHKLRICRASFLGYDHYLRDVDSSSIKSNFDLLDPCGLGRSVSQRFVEVVMGVRQPNTPLGKVVEHLPGQNKQDERFADLVDRPRRMKITDHDVNAYQLEVDNTTSHWWESIDGFFPNSNPATQAEWESMAATALNAWDEMNRSTAW